jgi:hypothetical protein
MEPQERLVLHLFGRASTLVNTITGGAPARSSSGKIDRPSAGRKPSIVWCCPVGISAVTRSLVSPVSTSKW